MILNDKTVLITGAAGFIGHHIVNHIIEHRRPKLIKLVDDLSNGLQSRLDRFSQHPNVVVIRGDLSDMSVAEDACGGVDYICHQAALGSVPRSIADPLKSINANVTGFANLFEAARHAGVKKVVYASSSSVYGDIEDRVKSEHRVGKVLSPYAATKATNEILADAFTSVTAIEAVGLRYFNIFGPGQNPNGPYAAVIPRFITAVLNGQNPVIYGDGSSSRDFTPVINAVTANLLAMETKLEAKHTVFNVACGNSLTVKELWDMVRVAFDTDLNPTYANPRVGDIPHSLADISKAKKLLGYVPDANYQKWIRRAIASLTVDRQD